MIISFTYRRAGGPRGQENMPMKYRRFARELGASGLTYGLAVGLIAVVCIAAVQDVGSKGVNPLFEHTGETLRTGLPDTELSGGGDSEGGGGPSQDVLPDNFDFADVPGAEPGSQVSSGPVSLSGFTGSITVSVSGDGSPEFSVGGDSFSAASRSMTSGQSLELRLTAPAGYEQSATAIVSAGDGSADWEVATRAIDAVPDAYQSGFTNVSDASVNTDYDTVFTVSGFDGTLSFSASITAGSPTITMRTGSNSFVSGPINVASGDQVTVRLHTSGTFGQNHSVHMDLGGVGADWTVATVAGCNSGSASYSSSGSFNFTVPPGCTSITVKAWGGGGGGGFDATDDGGGGAYVAGTLTVFPNETLTVLVGGGGSYNGTGVWTTQTGGGFNGGGNAGYSAGGGGGASEIRRSGTALLVAAGGGGGSDNFAAGAGGAGGPGGVGTGSDGTVSACSSTTRGRGATTGSGGVIASNCNGASGNTAGGAGQGGHGAVGTVATAGGGGGGVYGGSGGGGTGSGGGGGVSLVPAGGTGLAGSGFNPGNALDTDRGTAGNGADDGKNGASNAAGKPGKILISY
jgi:Flp pilus assembly pilin Flp